MLRRKLAKAGASIQFRFQVITEILRNGFIEADMVSLDDPERRW
jgi:hypothetical protein